MLTKTTGGLKATENTLPFDAYAEMRKQGEVVWDESVNAWVATSYAACREIFSNDKVLFRHPDGDAGDTYADVSSGRRSPKTLTGEEHRQVHAWMIRHFSPAVTSRLQSELVANVVSSLLDDFGPRGKAELVSDFADHIPVRVISAILALPWQDEEFIRRAKRNLDALGVFFNSRMAFTEELKQTAKAAIDDLRLLLDPFLKERQRGTGEDLISGLWRDGPGLLPNFTIEDVFIILMTVYLGGADTTTLAIANALYLLLTDDKLMKEIQRADDNKLRVFVEESLRLLPPVHYRARRANDDTMVAGQEIRKDDYVIPLMGAANRDPEKYGCPFHVDLERKVPRDHLTFIQGPRSCVGAGLARAEIFESVKQIIERIPDMKLDPDAKKPEYVGLTLRRFTPLNVVFTPSA